MNRDNALYGLMGLVIGFVAAYPMFEMLSARQPALRLPGAATAGEVAAAGRSAPPPPRGPQVGPEAAGRGDSGAAGSGPAMEQVQELARYVQENPDDAEAVLALAQLNLSINNLPRARELMARYVELRPDDHQNLLFLANLSFDQQDFAAARDGYERYLELQPATPDVLTDLGVALHNLGEHRQALAQLDRAREIDPDHWVSLFNRVIVEMYGLEDFEAATQSAQELQRLQPDNPDVDRLVAELDRLRSAA